MRTIIIGDIHACYDELQVLLKEAKATSADRIISVGDLVAKGPSTVKTLDFVMSLPNFRAVMGNHDYYLVKSWKAGTLEELSGSHRAAVREMGNDSEKYLKYLSGLPFYLELDDCIVVHAGIRPGLPLAKQNPEDLLQLRTLPGGLPWYQAYEGDKLIVYGHWAKQGLTVSENTIGLDTGCVYGGKLSACILPGRTIISTPAKKAYAPKG